MKESTFIPLALFAFAASAAPLVLAEPGPASAGHAQAAIQAAYDSSNAAAAKKDIDGMFAACAPDFVAIMNGRQVDLPKERKVVSVLMGMIVQSIKNTTKIDRVTLQGDAAVVDVTEHQVIIVAPHRVEQQTPVWTSDNVCRDYWVHTAQGWREKRTRVVSSKIQITGTGFNTTKAFHW